LLLESHCTEEGFRESLKTEVRSIAQSEESISKRGSVVSTTYSTPVPYPFTVRDGLELDDGYRSAQAARGLIRIEMPHGEPAWLATRYADVRLVLGDKRFSRAEALRHDEPRLRPRPTPPGSLLAMDPPEHTRLRRFIVKAFSARQVERLRPRVRQIAEDLVDDMMSAGAPIDLVDAFALPLPVTVICELLGVPSADRNHFRRWTDSMLSTSALSPAESAKAHRELLDYIRGLIPEKRDVPGEDLISLLTKADDDLDHLSENEVVGICAALLIAGHETTASQIPNFLLTLFEHPDQLARLRAQPELLAGAVEELLRFIPLGAGGSFPRYATEDIWFGDTLVRAGEPVLPAIGAANRDALQFNEADMLRIDRPATQHLGFGHGAHHCAGAALARVELQEALRTLLTRLPRLQLAGDIEWKTQMLVRGAISMPIAW
jgi:cytochrome P450